MRTLWCAVAVVVLSSCNDREQVPDSGTPDSGVFDAGTPVTERYVVKSVRMPISNSQARDYGVDVNGDDSVDNQFGMVAASFAQMGFDDTTAPNAALARGDDLTLVQTTALGGEVSVFALTGKNPQPTPCADGGDTVCGRHFVDGQFEYEAPAPGALVGTVNGTVVTATGTSTVKFPLAYFGAVVKVSVQKPQLQLVRSDAGVVTGRIAGSTPTNETVPLLNEAARVHFASVIAAECTGGAAPACGCPSGSTAATMLNLFEVTPKDCVITIDEIAGNSILMSLLAADVMVDGQPALSLGYEFDVVPARFNGP